MTTMSHPITSTLGRAERDSVGELLQAALLDLIDLSLVAKQAHWNVVGRHFRDVHLHLDELVATARKYTDDVAERAAAIGVSPDGRVRTVAAGTRVPEFPEGWQADKDVVRAIVETLDVVALRMRTRVEESDKSDLVTQDLFIEITTELEKARWMWQAQLAET
ncbi:DNA starvation/stationary phase protection protein [Longimycelium tulufanense]|uniref:DNA starvation/stationary phase protection protein n=1 Tax=Longimycelium tulufanense TaxID=907463 RepID=A0A8J3CJS9_9PSEU|nr:DNA starvation/stationary phase protection protein [Longimycelium tulufanense]GGM77481.1 DNA starvation/stationary phase protection protein [Longimycelium tulufanense]